MRTSLLLLLLVACAGEPTGFAPTATAPASEPAAPPSESERLAELMAEIRRADPRRSDHVYPMRAVEAIGTDEAQDSLLAYASDGEPHRASALSVLVILRSAKLAPWLTEHADELDGEDWSGIAVNVGAHCRDAWHDFEGAECWRDPVVMRLLLDRALDPQTELSARDALFRAFAEMATLEQARALAHYLDATPRVDWVTSVFWVLARYDAPELTERVRMQLTQSPDAGDLRVLVKHGLVRFERHDLLLELASVRSRLEAGELGGGSYAFESLREELAKAVPALEAARSAGVEPGLPLDWPETTDDYEPPAP